MAAHPRRHALKQKIHNFFQMRLHVVQREIRGEQAHAAVDVEPDTAGRDDAAFADVHCRHAANRETIAAVTIGHAERVACNPGQRRDVADLLIDGFVHLAHEFFRRDNSRRHAHAFLVGRRQFPNCVRNFFQAIDDRHGISYSYSFSCSCSCSNSDLTDQEQE